MTIKTIMNATMQKKKMNPMSFIFSIILLGMISSCIQISNQSKSVNMDELVIRIAELEIDSNYISEYNRILSKEASASIRLESGVLCIYPMFESKDSTQIRILEIYADISAYESHLKTTHFLHYKNSTLSMVKNLKLIDMEAIDIEMMSVIFNKIN